MKLVAIQTSLCAVAGRGGDSFNCLGFNVSEMWPDGEGAVGVKPEGGARASTSSDVEVFDERSLPAAGLPNIAQLNVTKSSGVHFGPKFVKVTQNVHNTEVVKDLPFHKYIWNLIKTSSTIERLSCAAALLFLGVLIGLIIFFTLTPEKVSDIEDRGPENWNITRTMWLAKPFQTNETTTPFEPLRLVVIQHTVSQECHRFIVCAAELRNLQGYFLKKYEYDIPYNFLVGNDGRVYEGRGWEKVGAHTRFYNRCSLGIGFIGDYREELPAHSSATELQMTRLKKLLSLGVSLGYIHPQYHVLAAKDIQETASPGSNLYRILQQWSHYDNGTNFVNKTCEDMYANFHEDG